MRLPVWMGVLSVAGVLSMASAQVDPAAKKALEESAEAIKGLGPCTFNIKMGTEGLGNFGLNSDMNVKLIRGSGKQGHSYQMIGEFIAAGAKPEDGKVHAAYIEGKMGEWIDPASKTLFIRPLKGAKTDQPSKDVLNKVQTPNKAFEALFLDPEPFKTELSAASTPQLTMEKAVTIDGEECQVVKATMTGGSAYRLVYISALDKLPRKYEQVMGKPTEKQMIRRFEIKQLNTEVKLTLADIHLKEPAGFKTDKVDLPPPPPPAPAVPKVKPDAKRDAGKNNDAGKEKEKELEKEKEAEKEKGKEKEKEQRPVGPESEDDKPGRKP